MKSPRRREDAEQKTHGATAKGVFENAPLAASFIFLSTFAVFLPATNYGFVDWDDVIYLLSNVHIRAWNWANIRWMCSALSPSSYHPLTWMSYALDYQLWQLNPHGYHATDIILHAVNASLFFFIALRLLNIALSAHKPSGNILVTAASFAALCFALHPLRVEPAVWISARKDVLSSFFYLAALLVYLKALDGRRKGLLIGFSWTFFVLSLLSKYNGIGFPLTLIILDVIPLRRLPLDATRWLHPTYRRIFFEKLAFALPALAMCVIAYLSRAQSGAARSFSDYEVALRAAHVCYGLIFYFGKTLFPIGLSPTYPHPSRNPSNLIYLLSALGTACISGFTWHERKSRPGLLAAWSHYVVTLGPVLGILPIASQAGSDRYSYISCLGYSILAGSGLALLLLQSQWRRIGATAAVAILLILAGLTRAQIPVWHDSISLWSHAVLVNPHDSMARYGLGRALAQMDLQDEAIDEYKLALRESPYFGLAHNDLGLALEKQGRMKEALLEFQVALKADPGSASARKNLERAILEVQERHVMPGPKNSPGPARLPGGSISPTP